MSLVVYSILFSFIHLIGNYRLEATTLCAGSNVTSEPVIAYCNGLGGYLIDRCCRSPDNATFVAVDLMGLHLIKIPDFAHYDNFNLSVIDLRSNPQLEPTQDEDFLKLKNLDDLILPKQMDCPGGERVWEIVETITDPIGNRCRQQKDFCSNLTDVCVEQSSICSTNGPNHFLCLCKPEYHGYKCLRQGKFPTGVFFGTTIAVTVLASILLYWTQRRQVTK